ncbi:2-hydroxychromene-2-carboxylate isomerase [Streptomyces sparsogenes]|uniref:2-hydroxychromene-2-carboxylate isomerase n=1 Tax=Streptomyces sparsogenes DSM 40356 TaxID=1331668 RepID=A0A1R1S6E1_9ACTN|nr:DsbA family protein [Streptomyces sparsogenes]OMI33885.1 isomerase [Streptomyces sparsogenes DSM 40356]
MARERGRVARFYFNFRSPYSWIAYRDLMDRYPDVAQAVEWRPWWEPDADGERLMNEHGETFPYTPMSREKHLYILQDVRRLARARGLDIRWPVDQDPVWEVPHLAYFPALDAGLGPRYIERVYRARWQEGRDICDPAVIAGVAEELGLPADRLAGAAGDRELREGRGLAALLALGRDGAFGVPFFRHGYDRFWGVDRLPAFVESVRAGPRGGAPAPPPPGPDLAAARSADHGHAGGCG